MYDIKRAAMSRSLTIDECEVQRPEQRLRVYAITETRAVVHDLQAQQHVLRRLTGRLWRSPVLWQLGAVEAGKRPSDDDLASATRLQHTAPLTALMLTPGVHSMAQVEAKSERATDTGQTGRAQRRRAIDGER